MRLLIDTMFISNNLPSLHFLWMENFAKHRNASKYYEIDCLQNFLLLFMFLLTTKFVKNSDVPATILFLSIKIVLNQTWNCFIIKSQPQWKVRKSSYQVREILGVFFHLIALILRKTRFKDLKVTKNVKEIRFEEAWGKIESKKSFQKQ